MKFITLLVLSFYLTTSKSEKYFDDFNTKADTSTPAVVNRIEARGSGYYSIYLGSDAIPDEGCSTNNRAVIVDSDAGSDVILKLAEAALINSRRITLRVDGCNPVEIGATYTAPKIITLSLIR